MVQPEYSPQEALDRIKLMMKYDTSKTLNENVESIKQPINEIVFLPWLIGVGSPALVAGIATWIYNVQGGGDSFSKTKSFFAGCKTNIKELKPTVSKSDYRAAADSIYNAVEGFGTNKDAIKTALNSMPTVADLCALNSWYSTQYGDLYEDLDGDIDGTDFTKYVWSAIAPKIADASDDLENTKKGDDSKKQGDDSKKQRSQIGGGYKPCTGTYTRGCKTAPEGAIGKVQGCLGLNPDGKFGPKTQGKLQAKGYTSFTDADVAKICGKQEPSKPVTPAGETTVDDVNNV